jgi:hypothetical protein
VAVVVVDGDDDDDISEKDEQDAPFFLEIYFN